MAFEGLLSGKERFGMDSREVVRGFTASHRTKNPGVPQHAIFLSALATPCSRCDGS